MAGDALENASHEARKPSELVMLPAAFPMVSRAGDLDGSGIGTRRIGMRDSSRPPKRGRHHDR